MEQVDGGELIVNRREAEGTESSHADEEEERNLSTVDGFVEANKVAETCIEALIKRHYKPPRETGTGAGKEQKSSDQPTHGRTRSHSNITLPVTECPVYLRIQPVLAPFPFSLPSTSTESAEGSSSEASSEDKNLFFLLILRDPTHSLNHKTLSQYMPAKWLDIPFEENEWVEDIMVDVIRRSVEIIGEEYVKGRMIGRMLQKAASGGEVVFDEVKEETDNEKVVEAQAGVSA